MRPYPSLSLVLSRALPVVVASLAAIPVQALPDDPDTVIGRLPDGQAITARDFMPSLPPGRIDFTEAIFGSPVGRADLRGAAFRGRNLALASLANTDCDFADFEEVDLRTTTLADGTFRGAAFPAAKLLAEDAASNTLQQADLDKALVFLTATDPEPIRVGGFGAAPAQPGQGIATGAGASAALPAGGWSGWASLAPSTPPLPAPPTYAMGECPLHAGPKQIHERVPPPCTCTHEFAMGYRLPESSYKEMRADSILQVPPGVGTFFSIRVMLQGWETIIPAVGIRPSPCPAGGWGAAPADRTPIRTGADNFHFFFPASADGSFDFAYAVRYSDGAPIRWAPVDLYPGCGALQIEAGRPFDVSYVVRLPLTRELKFLHTMVAEPLVAAFGALGAAVEGPSGATHLPPRHVAQLLSAFLSPLPHVPGDRRLLPPDELQPKDITDLAALVRGAVADPDRRHRVHAMLERYRDFRRDRQLWAEVLRPLARNPQLGFGMARRNLSMDLQLHVFKFLAPRWGFAGLAKSALFLLGGPEAYGERTMTGTAFPAPAASLLP